MAYKIECRRDGLGAEEAEPAIRVILDEHTEALTELRDRAARSERLRKIATVATVAGALFAAIRLTDIWLAVRRRQRGS
jgi:hypothetical protein